tara:strand:+ start:4606 stop:5067 length:462 start_codon:yes stop_codon:yes gene_type:complete
MDVVTLSGATGSFSKAGLAEGTNATTIKTAAPNGAGIDFSIGGVAYHKADTDNIAMTALSVQAVLTSCLYLVLLSAAGVLSIVKGKEELTANVGVSASLQWPGPGEDVCPIGGFRIDTNASVPFTCGTTDLGASGITDTYYDFIAGMPNRPVV